MLKHILGTVILLAALPLTASASGLGQDTWHFPTSSERLNPFFSDFKYFSFQSDDLSGEISYYVVGPAIDSKLNVIAHLYTRDQVWTYVDTCPLKDVSPSDSDASIEACGERAISVADDGSIVIRHDRGAVRWRLKVIPLVTYDGDDFSRDLPSVAPAGIDRTLFPWHMNWRPVAIDSVVTGDVTLSNAGGATETHRLLATSGYHDENWGVWLPMKQPYQWLRFSGVDQYGEQVHFVYADFYRSPDVGALYLVTPEGTRSFRPDELKTEITRTGRAASDYVSLTSDGEQLFVDPIDQDLDSGDHSIPIEFSLRSTDGTLRIRGTTILNAATAIAMPRLASWVIGNFFQNEQLVRFTLEYDSGDGTRAASGIGEQQYGTDQ